jgi:hypothetical protein
VVRLEAQGDHSDREGQTEKSVVSLADSIHVVIVGGDNPVVAFFNPVPAGDYAQGLRDAGESDSVEVVEVPLGHAHPLPSVIEGGEE